MTAEIVPFLYLLFIISVTLGGLYTVKKNELSSDGLIAGGFFGFYLRDNCGAFGFADLVEGCLDPTFKWYFPFSDTRRHNRS